MKKLLSLLLIQIILISPALASETPTINIISNGGSNITITTKSNETLLNRKEIFNFYADFFAGVTPESYKYIQLGYTDVLKGTQVYDSLQILVYYNLLENKIGRIYPLNDVSAYGFYTLSEKILGINILKTQNKVELKSRKANQNDLIIIRNEFKKELKILQTGSDSKVVKTKKEIFQDVYDVLSNQHYKKDDFTQVQLLDKAIEGLAEGTQDKHTTYFPPTENENFQESLNGEFEGIGAYVEMEKPGKFMIISPITDSPAYKAGLKGGDQILKVGDKEILPENSANEVISWIKGKKGTSIMLTILRGDKTLELEVTRDKIVIKDIETQLINSNTFLISITSFGQHVSDDFRDALIELSEKKYVNKIIIDLRNNGGGYLDQVADMLSYIVPEGEKTAIIKYLNGEESFESAGYELVDFSKYDIVILQNSGTASASEILAGTIKDYFPETTLLGEQSYGKGSVQRMKEYKDGSLLKYTIARWYTGGKEISIDGVGLTPDILLEFDIEEFEKNETDNQLNKAINIR